MQQELETTDTALAVQILGVNDTGYESGNSGIYTGRRLPWLQPESGEDVWTLWQVEYRDVVVLDPANEQLFVFNLTEHNLANPDAYDELTMLLLQAAQSSQ